MEKPEEALQKRQHEVQRLLGQCLLRLQRYELMMKATLAQHELSGSYASLETALALRKADLAGSTLGTLMRQMLGSFLVAAGSEQRTRTQDNDAPFSFRFQVGLSAEDLARTEIDLRELVDLRNGLVHHFLEQHDLSSLDGCDEAVRALTEALARVRIAIAHLDTWTEGMRQGVRQIAEAMSSPDVIDFLGTGQVPWPITGIVQALQEAETHLAIDGWTPVDAAGEWILARYPDESPEEYDRRSWRQVIHDCKLFELSYRRDGGRRAAWYRGRIGRPT